MSKFHGLTQADSQSKMGWSASVDEFDRRISIFTGAASSAFSITTRGIVLVKPDAATKARINRFDMAGQLTATAVRSTWLAKNYSRDSAMAEDTDEDNAPPPLSRIVERPQARMGSYLKTTERTFLT